MSFYSKLFKPCSGSLIYSRFVPCFFAPIIFSLKYALKDLNCEEQASTSDGDLDGQLEYRDREEPHDALQDGHLGN